jgi:hypothetical protein
VNLKGKLNFFGSLERNHAKLEAHQKNSKIFITVFNQILVSTGANHSVGEVWLLTGLQNAGGESMFDMIQSMFDIAPRRI